MASPNPEETPRRGFFGRVRRKGGGSSKKETVEKHLLSEWGWGSASTDTLTENQAKMGAAAGRTRAAPTKTKRAASAKDVAAKPTKPAAPPPDATRQLRPSITAAAAAKGAARLAGQPEAAASPNATAGSTQARSVSTLRPGGRNTPVENRPPRAALPAADLIPVDFYIAYHPSDERTAVALSDVLEAKAHRLDDSTASSFVDVKNIAHLRIGDKKWRKKADTERLGRLRGAAVTVCLISNTALDALREAHTAESVLLWEIEMALVEGKKVVPLLLTDQMINIAAFSRQPAFHPLGSIDARSAVSQLLQRPSLRATGSFASSADRIALELGAFLRGNPLRPDSEADDVVVEDEVAADALEELELAAADPPSASITGADGASPSRKASDPELEENTLYGDPEEDEDDIENWGHWQLDRAQITTGEKIGEGEFGEVIKGKLHGTGKHEGMVANVAIKVQTKGSRLEFLQEARTMVQLHQKNLVNIYGVCTTDDPVLIVSELCEHGSLKSFLSTFRASSLSVLEIRHMIKDICTAMAYIAGEDIIHRDLAARNVLVEEPLRCKVADFGMAVEPGDDGIFHGDRSQPVPIRWSAPEAILYGHFSTKSDVWSFGIVMYETITFGKEVYAGVTNKDVVRMVCKENTRLPCPTKPRAKLGCTKELHDVMLACWEQDPNERPTFDRLLEHHLPSASIS